MKMTTRILSIILCLAMVIGYFTIGVAAEGETVTLVTDVSTLAVGDKVVIANAAGTYAISTTQNTNNRVAAAITVDGNSFTVPANVQVFTLEAGVTEGTWAFKTETGYIYAASTSSNHLKTKATLDENGSFSIEIAADGVATIKRASNATRGWMRFNTNNGSPIFSCYTSGQQDIVIYKVMGSSAETCDHTDPAKLSTQRDATNHWTHCSCGTNIEDSVAAHDTNGEKGVCSVCGFVSFVQPALNTNFNVGIYQSTLDKFFYFTGAIDGRYLSTTEDVGAAADVYLEEAEGGYYLYFMDGDTKTYIDMYVSDTAAGYVNAVLSTEPNAIFTYDAEYNTFVATMTTEKYGEDIYFFGTNGNYTTLGTSHDGNLPSYYAMHLYAAETPCAHIWDDGVETQAPTTSTEGVLTYTCTLCGATYTESIPTVAPTGDTYALYAETTLVSGTYILLTSNGYAPNVLESGWLLPVQVPFVDGKAYATDGGAWTLTVVGTKVTFKDSAGNFVAPKGGNNNGIAVGEYSWNWIYDADKGGFIFTGDGEDTVYLSANLDATNGQNRYRGYKITTVDGDTKGNYLNVFTLYKLEGEETPDVPPVDPETCEHSWDAGKVTTEPTVDAEGVKTFTCVLCGTTKTESIDKLEPSEPDVPVVPEGGVFVQVTDGKLVSGQYVLISSTGYALGAYDNGWVTALQPSVTDGVIADALGAVWTLTVDGNSVILTDANGVAVAPKGGNNNGIISGEYSWTWSFADGAFTFDGVGEDTVRLAGNTDSDNKFRGYKVGTVTGQYASKYPSTFVLYKLDDGASEPECEHAWDAGVETTAPSYSAPGVKTYTCTLCGETKTEEIAQLTWTAGIINPKSVTLSLDDLIFLNVYSEYTGGTLSQAYLEAHGGLLYWNEAVYPGDDKVSILDANAVVVHGLSLNASNGRYLGTTEGIALKNLGDTLKICSYVELPDGTIMYSRVIEYSGRKYAESRIKNIDGTANPSAKLVAERDVCISMLNAVYEAQKFFKHNLENPANASLSANRQVVNYSADMITAPIAIDRDLTRDKTVFSSRGASLALEGKIELNYSFTIPAQHMSTAKDTGMLYWSREDYERATVLDASSATYTGELEATTTADKYSAKYPKAFATKEYEDTVYACAYLIDADGNYHYSGIIAYNVEAYAKSKINSNSAEADLCKALVVYGEKAKAYFAI